MKKKILIGIIISSIILMCFLAVLAVWGYEKINMKNTLDLDIKVFLNKREINLEQCKVSCKYDNRKCEFQRENGIYRIYGSDYGSYDYTIILPTEETSFDKPLVIQLSYYNTDNWESLNSQCKIELKSNENSVSGKYRVHMRDKVGEVFNYEGDIEETGEDIYIRWGL